MIKMKIVLISVLFVCSLTAAADYGECDRTPTRGLVMKYAESHGTNFVISPKVEGEVELSDIAVEKMSLKEFLDVLGYHDYIVTRNDGVMYVFTRFEVEYLGKGVGSIITPQLPANIEGVHKTSDLFKQHPLYSRA